MNPSTALRISAFILLISAFRLHIHHHNQFPTVWRLLDFQIVVRHRLDDLVELAHRRAENLRAQLDRRNRFDVEMMIGLAMRFLQIQQFSQPVDEQRFVVNAADLNHARGFVGVIARLCAFQREQRERGVLEQFAQIASERAERPVSSVWNFFKAFHTNELRTNATNIIRQFAAFVHYVGIGVAYACISESDSLTDFGLR